METTFCFSDNLQYILYGVNLYSKRLFRNLSDAGYQVVAFFDKRYEELAKHCPIPVYGLSNHPYINLEKSNFCVVIMLQNAMQHEMIAMELMRQGFHKILFVPMRNVLEESAAQTLRFRYNMLLMGQFQILKEIPLLSEHIVRTKTDTVYSVIREEGDFKIIWCPIELLYTNPPRLCQDPAIGRYANVPLYSYFPYVSMFEYLQGNSEKSGQYLDEYGVNSCKYKNSLTNAEVVWQRKQLLEIYRDALNRGMDFFISSAPPAEWNGQFGVFNLLEGQHRSLFLAMEGFRYIPVRVSQKDFENWNVVCPAGKLQRRMKEGEERPHILHPKYKSINENSDRNDLMYLESIQKYLGGPRDAWRGMLEGKTVLDLSGTYGYYARNAYRMWAEKVVLYTPEGVEISKEIQALEGFPDIFAVDDWSRASTEPYHVLFVLEALSDMHSDIKESWIDRCADLCLEECFVIARDFEELGLWKRRFSKVQELKRLFDREGIVGLYVLQK